MKFKLTPRSMQGPRSAQRPLFGAAMVVLILAPGVLAGCGGGSGDRLTQEEFLRQGNAICAKGTEHIDAAGATAFASPGNPTESETVTFAKNVIVPTVQDELDQLWALSPPTEDEARVEEILDKAQAAVDQVKADPALLVKDNGFEEANRLAGDYGLTDCAG